MVAPCSKCRKPSVYHARYSGQHLCRDHFLRFYEKRARKELRRQGPYPAGSVLAVALSGGKDSVAVLHLVHEAFRNNPTVHVVAVSVDEGIRGYRAPSLEVAADHCRELGVEHRVLSYAELEGWTMDEVVKAKTGGQACTYCGPMRRRTLNAAAKEVGATHLVTGHNLDDTAQTVLMNHLRGDLDRMARMGPHPPERRLPGLIPRILPLRVIPEKEVALAAILQGWAFHDGECPYSVDATRGRYRDLLLQLERDEPGTRHRLVAGYDRLAPLLWDATPPADVDACERCGEPASSELCKPCALFTSLQRPRQSS